MTNVSKDSLGARIKKQMTDKGLNQTSLAKKAGIDRTQLNRLIHDKREPRQEELTWLAQALGTTVPELLAGLSLPDTVRQTMTVVEDAVRRSLAADGAREEAQARLEEAERAHHLEREEWKVERGELRKGLDESRQALHIAEGLVEEKAAELRRLETAFADERTTLTRANEKLRVVETTQRIQLSTLQAQLAQERLSRNATGLMAGLFGLLGGAALTSREND